ncbi:hypothetical protein [Enterococcus sp. HY326]|uniref:hypothetical protein n=1 Tax=Enterococcus sp. HY326 TaxID=2971265 RepID=UPI002240DB99|nr:hypothetical protein [Enterococcus sp. HY326]
MNTERATSKKNWKFKVIEIALIVFGYFILSFLATGFSLNNHIIFDGNDMNFHLNRILSLENVLQSPVNLEVLHSVGLQVNNFYGWLTLYPALLLVKLVDNIGVGYNLYMLFITLLTFLSSHYSALKITHSHRIGFIFSLLYVFSTYRMVNIYTRAALGEVIAMTFLPLVFCGVYLILKNNKQGILMLAFSFSLIVYSHVITSFLAFLFVVLCYLSYGITHQKKFIAITLSFVKSGFLILLLSLGFLVPLLINSEFQELNMPFIADLASNSFNSGTLLVEGLNNSYSTISLGLLITALLVTTLLQFKNLNKVQKVGLILGALAFIMSTKLFPWSILQSTLFTNIQFPWRFLGLTSLFIGFAGAIYINEIIGTTRFKKLAIAVFALILIMLNMGSIRASSESLNATDYSQVTFDSVTRNVSLGRVDYSPVYSKEQEDQLSQQIVTANGLPVEAEVTISANQQNYGFIAENQSEIVLPVFRYAGLTLTNNGQEIESEDTGPLVSFQSQQGENNIVVSYHYPLLSKLAWIISITSFLIVIGIQLFRKYR